MQCQLSVDFELTLGIFFCCCCWTKVTLGIASAISVVLNRLIVLYHETHRPWWVLILLHVLPVCHHSGPNSKVHQLCISSPLHLFIPTCNHKPPASPYGGIVGILCSVICWQSDLRRIWSIKPPFEIQEASHLALIIRSFQALCLRLRCPNFICQQREIISQVDMPGNAAHIQVSSEI